MTKDYEKKFGVFMAVLATAFKESGISKEKIGVYFHYLNDIPIELIERAVEDIIKTRVFSSMPTIAEIRNAALGLQDGRIEAEALEAWNKAERLLLVGPDSADPVLTDTIRLAFGGWRGFGESDPTDGYLKKRFIDCYKIAARRNAELPMLGEGKKELKKLRALMAAKAEPE